MTTQAQGIITDGRGKFSLRELEICSPGPREVTVQIRASGICHTDFDSLSWGRELVLGHEGAGVVVATGSEVTRVQPGDSVLLNWAISCGNCFQCRRGNHSLCETHSPVCGRTPDGGHAHPEATLIDGRPVRRSFHLGTMSTMTVVREEAVVKLPAGIPFASACILGCGVMTGYGSVANAARVYPGSDIIVIGCGGVGLNVIQGAKISGALKIIAIDLRETRLNMALQFGATHVIQAQRNDNSFSAPIARVRELTQGRGGDFAFECTANPALGAAPLLVIRHGGMAVQVSGIEQELNIDMSLFEWDKTYINPLYGKCCPERDFPILFDLYSTGRLLLDELVSKTYWIDQLSSAFQDMHEGSIAKGVILFDD